MNYNLVMHLAHKLQYCQTWKDGTKVVRLEFLGLVFNSVDVCTEKICCNNGNRY
jgi:hypothetical protein